MIRFNITDPPPPIIMEYLMSSKVTHKSYSQSPSSFLHCDPDFVLWMSNYTKFRSHHLAFNQFYPENFQDIDQQSNSSNNSQVVSGTHSFASESKGFKRICWSGFYICFRKSIWVKPLKVVEKVKQNKKMVFSLSKLIGHFYSHWKTSLRQICECKNKIIFTAIRFCVDTFVLYFDTSIKHFH